MLEIIKMDDNTWRIENEFVRFFLLEGTKQAVLIDSGFNCENAKEIAEGITSKPVILLNTHGDGDHTSGTAAFAEIYMTEEDYYGCQVAERYPNTKLRKITDCEVIDLGERTIRIITISGHTKEVWLFLMWRRADFLPATVFKMATYLCLGISVNPRPLKLQ